MSNQPEHCECGALAKHCSLWGMGHRGHGYTGEITISVSACGEHEQEWDTFNFRVSLEQAKKLREAVCAAISEAMDARAAA